MTVSQERSQRGADPRGMPIVGFSAWPGADGVLVPDTALNDDVAHRFQAYELGYLKVFAQFRRADELDAQALYYSDQAMQEVRARGRPNYYVGLLRALATDRAAMAQRLRTGFERRDECPRFG